MKKSIITIAVAALALASCEKAREEQKDAVSNNPIPVTVELSIGAAEPETKLSYTLDGNVLKSSWQTGDKVSLITCYNFDPYGGDRGRIVSIDNLTAESDGKTVRFTGTFSNPTPVSTGTLEAKIIYPALEGTAPAASPKEPQNNQASYGPFYVGDDEFLHLDGDRKFIQPMDNSTSNLQYYTLMVGDTDLAALKETGVVSATLVHLSYILKADLTMPDRGYNFVIKRVGIIQQVDEGVPPVLRNFGATDFHAPSFRLAGAANLWTYMHDVKSDGSVSDIGVVFNRGKTHTVYFVGGFSSDASACQILGGKSKLRIVAEGTENGVERTLSATLNVTGGVYSLRPGDMYRLSATLAVE